MGHEEPAAEAPARRDKALRSSKKLLDYSPRGAQAMVQSLLESAP